MLLNQSEKATYCMTPTIWHAGKGPTMETVVGKENFFLCTSKVLTASLSIKLSWHRLTEKMKFHSIHIGISHKEVQRQKGKMRNICHPELRNGIGAWHFKGRKVIHRTIRRADVW